MPIDQSKRDAMIERLVNDRVDDLVRWAIQAQMDELYNYVIQNEEPNRLGDEELENLYDATFGEDN